MTKPDPDRWKCCQQATEETPCYRTTGATASAGRECPHCGLLVSTIDAMLVGGSGQMFPGARDLNWHGLPGEARGFAAIGASGEIIVNSVRDRRDAVRLAAGECDPVPVRISYVLDPEPDAKPDQIADRDWIAIARSLGAKLDEADNGMWRILDQPDTPFWWAYFLDERTAAFAYCEYVRERATARG